MAEVHYFRQRRPGPELRLENAVAQSMERLFPRRKGTLWAGGSLPVGAGAPDILVVAYRDEVLRLGETTDRHIAVLAYLRSVSSALPSTIASRLGQTEEVVTGLLRGLSDIRALRRRRNAYALSS